MHNLYVTHKSTTVKEYPYVQKSRTVTSELIIKLMLILCNPKYLRAQEAVPKATKTGPLMEYDQLKVYLQSERF